MPADLHIIHGVSYTESPDEIRVFIPNRFDTDTAPTMEVVFGGFILRSKLIVADFCNCTYIRSAGLRVLLSVHKRNDGLLLLDNVHGDVREIIDINGFSDIFAINIPAEKIKDWLNQRKDWLNQRKDHIALEKIRNLIDDDNKDDQTKRQEIIRIVDECWTNPIS